jgi:hypothetical protein
VLRKVLILTAMVCGLAFFPATAFAIDIDDIEAEIEDQLALINQQVNAQEADVDQEANGAEANANGGDGGNTGNEFEGDVESEDNTMFECSPGSRGGTVGDTNTGNGSNGCLEIEDVGNNEVNDNELTGGANGGECSPGSRGGDVGGSQGGSGSCVSANGIANGGDTNVDQTNECSPGSRSGGADAGGGGSNTDQFNVAVQANDCQDAEGGNGGDGIGGDAGDGGGPCCAAANEVVPGHGGGGDVEGGDGEGGDGGEAENSLEAENNAIVEGGDTEAEGGSHNAVTQNGGTGGNVDLGVGSSIAFLFDQSANNTQNALHTGNANGGAGGVAVVEIDQDAEVEQESEQDQDIDALLQRIRDSFNGEENEQEL